MAAGEIIIDTYELNVNDIVIDVVITSKVDEPVPIYHQDNS